MLCLWGFDALHGKIAAKMYHPCVPSSVPTHLSQSSPISGKRFKNNMASSTVSNTMRKYHCSALLRTRSRRPSNLRSGRRRTTTFFTAFLATTFSAALAFAPPVSAATASEEVSSRHLSRNGHRFPSNNLPRRRRTVVDEREDKSNDDDAWTVVPLRPFSFRLSTLPPASPMLGIAPIQSGDVSSSASAIVNTPAMDKLLEYVSDLGARTFRQSPAYGHRFEEWDAGTVWSLGGGGGEFVFSTSASEMSRNPHSAEPEVARISDDNGDEYGIFDGIRGGKRRKLLDDAPSEGTIVLTLGHNGTVTFKGVHWEDGPDSNELTEDLVQAMNADENKEGLLQKVGPLVCDAGDLIGGSCDVKLEVTSGSDVVVVEDAEVIVEGDAQGGTGEPELPMDDADGSEDLDESHAENEVMIGDAPSSYGTNNSEQAQGPEIDSTSPGSASKDGSDGEAKNEEINLVGAGTIDGEANSASADNIDASTNSLEGIPPDSRYPSLNASSQDPTSQESNEFKLQATIIIIIGAVLIAFLIAGLLYRHRRNKRRQASAREGELLHNAMQYNMRDWSMTSVEATPQELQASNEDVMSAKSLCGGSWTPTTSRPADSSTAATAGASVAATSLAAAAGCAPDHHINNSEAVSAAAMDNATDATKKIDKMLKELSGGDSSLVSDSSPATTSDGYSEQEQSASGSILGGLTGLFHRRKSSSSSTSSPTPLESAAPVGSRLSTNGITSDEGYLPESLQNADPPPKRLQKQESFEGTYRSRSAMHTMNLKKDILHVACDTHDTPEAFDEGGEYGVTRTISPQKSTDMKEKQRLSEKWGFSHGGRHQRLDNEVQTAAREDDSKEERRQSQQREDPNPLAVPVGFERSDSARLVSWSGGDGGGSSSDSTLSSNGDSKGDFPGALV